jgi:guanosine-3',5'-bis(diphosphate) 3'-pyrophosphohydrolase
MDAYSIIQKTQDFAEIAHGNQKRRFSDQPYIVHPVRVMKICQEYTDDITVHAAALLHDVLEDTNVTESELGVFLNGIMNKTDAEKTLKQVVELTDVFIKANFPRMNRNQRRGKEAERLSTVSGEAQTVKYADIIDNTDITFNDPDFARVYLKESQLILEKMNQGHPDLHQRAIAQVADCLNRVSANGASIRS